MYSFIIQIIRKEKKRRRRKKEKGKEKVRQLNNVDKGCNRKGLYDDSDK